MSALPPKADWTPIANMVGCLLLTQSGHARLERPRLLAVGAFMSDASLRK